jgi:hypothetical protein
MTHDDERDYAEERANLADMRREHEQEAAHEALVGRVTQALRELAFDAYDGGRAALDRLHEEIVHRQAPNAHRYELLARQQHTALLAAMTATGVEEFAGYDLLDAAQGVTEAYVTTHRPPSPDDLLGRALSTAVARVVGTVQAVLDADEQEQIDAREQADLDQTEAYLRRVTR